MVIRKPENGDDSQGGCRLAVVRLLDANQHPESQNLVPSTLDPAGGDGVNGIAECSSLDKRCAGAAPKSRVKALLPTRILDLYKAQD